MRLDDESLSARSDVLRDSLNAAVTSLEEAAYEAILMDEPAGDRLQTIARSTRDFSEALFAWHVQLYARYNKRSGRMRQLVSFLRRSLLALLIIPGCLYMLVFGLVATAYGGGRPVLGVTKMVMDSVNDYEATNVPGVFIDKYCMTQRTSRPTEFITGIPMPAADPMMPGVACSQPKVTIRQIAAVWGASFWPFYLVLAGGGVGGMIAMALCDYRLERLTRRLLGGTPS